MAYEAIMLYHLHMPLCFLGTFTEYPYSNRLIVIWGIIFITSVDKFYFLPFIFFTSSLGSF